MPKHMKTSESSLARKRAALIRSPSKVSKRASTTDTKLCTPEERARERRPRLLLEDNSDADADSAKKSDGNSSDDRAKASVEHDAAHGANAVPLTSQVAAVTVADVAAQIDARGSVSIAADRAGNNAIGQGKKGVFAVAAPNPLQRKIDSVKRGLTLLQSAFDVPNVNELDEHDRVRLRQAFVEATEVYAHDTLILRAYDRANDEYDWPALISHVTNVKTMLRTTQTCLQQQLKSGPPKASQPQLKYLQSLGYDENAGGNTKLNALNMDEARMLITSLKAAKAFRDA